MTAGPGNEPGVVAFDPDDHPDGLVVADATGRVLCVNAAAARLTGTAPETAVGQPLDRVLPLSDPEGHPWWEHTRPFDGLPTRTRMPERTLRLPDGRELLVTARFVRDRPAGRLRSLVVALRGAEARARAERDHADLITTCAHELRSPLTSVKGFAATLIAKWNRFTDEQKLLFLETINADADRLGRLVAELLDISRIDSGRIEVRRQPVHLDAAVRAVVNGMVMAGQPADRFVVRCADTLPPLWLDPDKLGQIITNLLENAVRHGDGTVTVTIEPAPGGAAITVDDEGPGIDDAAAARVFTKFWRGNRRGGTGLGLYIVKGLVEAHGGTVTVGRSPASGARFRFVLPTGEPPPDLAPHLPGPRQAATDRS